MIKRIFIMIVLALLIFQTSVWAQDKDNIILTTRPAGATIYLNGEYEVVANAPARLPSSIAGRYNVKITRPGYETWKGILTFVPGSANNMTIDLSRKTRFKSCLRSIFIPGWGQIYSGQTLKGSAITGAAILSAASFYFADKRYQKKKTDFDIAMSEYRVATSAEDQIRLKVNLDSRQRSAYQAETDRRTAMGVAAAVWAYNIIDALIFFPDNELFYPSAVALNDGAMLKFTMEF